MNTTCDHPPGIAECAFLACLLEATARKPGNVHRYRDFADLTYLDFVLSASVSAPVLAEAAHRGVGPTVLEAIRRTRQVVNTNTNLGMMLLLAPLAAVPAGTPFAAGIARVLAGLSIADARAVYAAIRLASPGGMGRVDEEDVAAEPTLDLRAAMRLAMDRDTIARQYINCYGEVFKLGVPALLEELDRGTTVEEAIILCHLRLMAELPDTLIARKCGGAIANESAARARSALAAGGLKTLPGQRAIRDLDEWLRVDGHRRNPGTTADLVAACLFVTLREGRMTWPSDRPFAAPGLS